MVTLKRPGKDKLSRSVSVNVKTYRYNSLVYRELLF